MNFITVLLLALIFAFVSAGVVDLHQFDVPAIDDEGRIVNGSDARTGQFPHQVSIRTRRKNEHFCGGSIISAKWILTAAHCIYRRLPRSFVAVAGTNHLDNGGIVYDIKGNHPHPKYKLGVFYYDIGLLHTSAEIQFNDFVKAIKLPTENTPAKLPVIISGWGRLSADADDLPNKLQYLNSTTIDGDECKDRLPPNNLVFDTFLCHFTGEYSGACYGDSGKLIK